MAKPLGEFTDEELIAEFQQGNEGAFTELVLRFKDPLTNFAYRFIGDWDECSDIVQETFIRVYRGRHSYKPIAKFSTWIYTIASNQSKSHLRRKKLSSVFRFGGGTGEKQSPQFEPIDEHEKADRLAESSVLGERIQKAIGALEMKYREVIILRDIQDLTYEEIAEVTHLNIGTVKSRINRARGILQEKLKDVMD